MKKCPACGKEYEDANTLCPADGAVLRRTEDSLIGQVLAGKYRIEEKIDEGGMGCVYRATHVLMEKTVAIKVLHPALAADDKIVARFTREAKAASRISHPHAIVVTDFGESEQGVVYLVMEYLRGRTLKDVVRDEGPMPLGRVTEIVRQVSGALDAAHEQGVVHRDLKSDNIMLEESGGGDWAKVLDFGIAKIQEPTDTGAKDDGLTAPNLIIGTPQYMSPEQCGQSSGIDRRSDIYSFGVILYEMLAGHVPFTGDSPTAIMMKHIQEPPPSILEDRPDLPAGVGRVVARALAKRPEDRFQRAGELPEALALAASEAPAEAVAAGAGDTERIVVPTASNDAPRTTVGDLDDEATVVSAEAGRARTDELPPVAPAPPASFNPWNVALPAIAALAVIFAVFFAYQRLGASSEPPAAEQPPLSADPNSRPAQPVPPPTGQAESNLVPASTPTPAAPSDLGGAPLTTADPGSFQTEASPTPQPGHEGHQGAENANQNTSGQPEAGEEEEDEPEATPEPTPRRRATPAPGPTVEAPPPPTPKPKPEAPPNTSGEQTP